MAQNPLAAFVAKTTGNVLAALNLDGSGNLKVALASDTAAALPVSQTAVGYVTVAASQSAKALGTGAIGDVIKSITYTPGTVAAGVITLIDGSGGGAVSIPIFVGGGTTALIDLRPITIPLNLASVVGGWHITTGANITAVATGTFTA